MTVVLSLNRPKIQSQTVKLKRKRKLSKKRKLNVN